MKIKKMIPCLLSFILLGCQTTPAKLITHIVDGEFIGNEFVFPMNTITQLRMYYDIQYNEVKDGFNDIIINLSKEVDRYHDYTNINNLKTLNDSCGSDEYIRVSNELYEIIKLGVELTKISEGKFNLAMGALIDLYSEKLVEGNSGTYNTLPNNESILKALNSTPSYDNIDKIIEFNDENKSIKLNKYNEENVVISLGAIAKGFVLQKVFDYLKTYNYPCLFDAGSSTMATMNNNPLSDSWRIGFNNPLINKDLQEENSEPYICTLSLRGDNFISTSGDYQKNFFYKDENGNDKLMHHIIDPKTGISNNYLRSVSLVSNNASLALLDATSTALFNCYNDEEAISLINKIETSFNCNINFIFVKPYESSYDKYNVVMNQRFNDLLNDNLPTCIINQSIVSK